MKQMLMLLIPLIALPLQCQQNQYEIARLPQRELNKKKLMPLLRHAIEIMASEEHKKDREKIMEFECENEGLSFVSFSPMHGLNSDFCARDGIYVLLQKIRKEAGFVMGPELGIAPMFLGKVVLNSVRLQNETIMLITDKARRDDKMFAPVLYITKPTELKDTPKLELNKKELIPLMRQAIEIMAGKDCDEDRKKIIESEDEEDALDYVMYFSDFCLRRDVKELEKKIQRIEKFSAGIGAAKLLLANIVLNSVRLQESTIMLITYETRLGDRMFHVVLSETPPPNVF
jgi:hypothetical protein